MSRCLKGIPHYNPKIVAPKMQSDIDKALNEVGTIDKRAKFDWRMNEEKTPRFDSLVYKKLYPKQRRKSVDKMTRKELVAHLDAMELPETDARDFDNNEIRQMLIDSAPDLFMSSIQQ
jgi:phenylalanine-4-hydroxylase